jgi:hypothetical protein
MPMGPPPKRITSGGVIAIIGGLMMIIAIMLDWAVISVSFFGVSQSVGGNPFDVGGEIMMYALIMLLMGILAMVVVVAKKPILAGIFGVIGLIMGLIAFLRVSEAAGILGGFDFMGVSVSAGAGLGLFLGLIGAILTMIGGFVGHKQMY